MSELLLPPSVRARETDTEALPTPDSFANPSWSGTSSPLFATPYLGGPSRGEDVVDFASAFLRATRGFKRGQPLDMTIWQMELIRRVQEEKDDGCLRYRQVLIGLPRKNGKSLIGTVLALHKLVFSDEGTQIFSAAKDREQAKIVFGEAARQVRNSRILSKMIKVNRDHMINRHTGAIYRALSADGGAAQGLAPELVIADEIHAWPDRAGNELWQALTEGSGDRPESQVIAITTAGKSMESLLGNLMSHGKGIIDGKIDDDSFGMFWWGAPPEMFAGDEATWMRANPNLVEGLYSLEDMRSRWAGASTVGLDGFERYRLNRFAAGSDDMWLTTDQVEKAFARGAGQTIPAGAQIAVGIDAAVSEDSTAIVGIDIRTGVAKILGLWEKEGPEWVLPTDELNAQVAHIAATFDVVMLRADRSHLDQSLPMWNRDIPGLRGRIVEAVQSPATMRPAVSSTKLGIADGHLKLVEDPKGAFKKHLSCAVRKSNGMLSKKSSRSREKIDIADALCVAMSAWTLYNKKMGANTGTTYGGF